MIITPLTLSQIYQQTSKISFCDTSQHLVHALLFINDFYYRQTVDFIVISLRAAEAAGSSGVATMILEIGVITMTTGISRKSLLLIAAFSKSFRDKMPFSMPSSSSTTPFRHPQGTW